MSTTQTLHESDLKTAHDMIVRLQRRCEAAACGGNSAAADMFEDAIVALMDAFNIDANDLTY